MEISNHAGSNVVGLTRSRSPSINPTPSQKSPVGKKARPNTAKIALPLASDDDTLCHTPTRTTSAVESPTSLVPVGEHPVDNNILRRRPTEEGNKDVLDDDLVVIAEEFKSLKIHWNDLFRDENPDLVTEAHDRTHEVQHLTPRHDFPTVAASGDGADGEEDDDDNDDEAKSDIGWNTDDDDDDEVESND